MELRLLGMVNEWMEEVSSLAGLDGLVHRSELGGVRTW